MSNYKDIVFNFCLVKTILLSSYKNFVLIFSLIKAVFSYFLVLVYLEWFVANIVQKTNKSKTSIGAIIKNTEMLRLVPDHLKTKKDV